MGHSDLLLRFFSSTVTRNVVSVITWVWIILDYVWRFSVEDEKILKPLLAGELPMHVSLVYVVTRYIGLIGQTISFVWGSVLLSSSPIQSVGCWRWFTFQSIVIQSLSGALHYVLILRVCALYSNHLGICVFLAFIWFIERGLVMYGSIEAFRAIQFDSTCLVDRTPLVPVVIMTGSVIAIQLILWGMSLAKLYKGPSCALTRQLIYDGALVFLSVIAFYTIVVPYTFLVNVLTYNTFSFLITLLSILGCRLILNLRRLQSVETPPPVRSTGSGTWCLDTLDSLNNPVKSDDLSPVPSIVTQSTTHS